MLRCVGSCPRAAGCDYCTQRAQLLGVPEGAARGYYTFGLVWLGNIILCLE